MEQIDSDHPFFVDLACMRIKLGITSNAAYATVYDRALNSVSTDFYKSVSEELENYIVFEELLISSIEFQNELIRGVVKIMLNNDRGERQLDIRKVLSNFMAIVSSNKIDSEILFLELDKYPEINLDYDFVFGLNSDELYQAAFESESKVARQLIRVIIDHFKSANLDTWNVVFDSLNSKELQILRIFEFNEFNAFALESFGKRLKRIAEDGEESDLENIEFITEQLEISGHNLVNTYKNLRDEFILTNRMSELQFSKLIVLLIKYGKLEEKAADALRTIFKSEFLDNTECLNLMNQLSDDLKKILDKCKHFEKSDFINAISARLENSEVNELCKKLGIAVSEDIKRGEKE
jgi:hypothetical protein